MREKSNPWHSEKSELFYQWIRSKREFKSLDTVHVNLSRGGCEKTQNLDNGRKILERIIKVKNGKYLIPILSNLLLWYIDTSCTIHELGMRLGVPFNLYRNLYFKKAYFMNSWEVQSTMTKQYWYRKQLKTGVAELRRCWRGLGRSAVRVTSGWRPEAGPRRLTVTRAS